MDRVFTAAKAKPKAIRAAASSRATTLRSVSVTGPLALYWRTTMMVAAGAVAEAMAPSSRASSRSKPKSASAAVTRMAAAKASITAMTMGVSPTFFR